MGLATDGWSYKRVQGTGTATGLAAKEFGELPNTGKESPARCIRYLICRWQDRADFFDSLVGWSVLRPDGTIDRGHPDQHPTYRQFFCTDWVSDPLGMPDHVRDNFGQYLSSKYAVVQATYTPVPYDVGDGDFDYISVEPDTNSEFQGTQDYYYFANTDGGQPKQSTGATQAILANSERLIVTWYRVPCRPIDPFIYPTIDTVSGDGTDSGLVTHVNSVPIQFREDGKIYPVGTVLFEGVKSEWIGTKMGGRGVVLRTMWNLAYTFRVIDHGEGKVLSGDPNLTPAPTATIAADGGGNIEHGGWNFRYHLRADKYVKITGDGNVSSKSPYPYGDLNDLFFITP